MKKEFKYNNRNSVNAHKASRNGKVPALKDWLQFGQIPTTQLAGDHHQNEEMQRVTCMAYKLLHYLPTGGGEVRSDVTESGAAPSTWNTF